jgi:hypothetical protein
LPATACARWAGSRSGAQTIIEVFGRTNQAHFTVAVDQHHRRTVFDELHRLGGVVGADRRNHQGRSPTASGGSCTECRTTSMFMHNGP